MKELLTLTLLTSAALIFTACGGGGSSTSASSGTNGGQSSSSNIVPLEINTSTVIEAGYSVVNSSQDAVLDIIVIGNTKTVTLKSGEASLSIPL